MASKRIYQLFQSTTKDYDQILENYVPLAGGIVRKYQVVASGLPELTETYSTEEIPTGLFLNNADVAHGFHVYEGDVVQKYDTTESEFLTRVVQCTLPGKIEAAAMSDDPNVSHAITGKNIYMFDDRTDKPVACPKASSYDFEGALTTRGDTSVVGCTDGTIRTFGKKSGFARADPNTGNLIHPMLPLSGARVLHILFPENSTDRKLAVVVAKTRSKLVVYAAALDVSAKKGDASMPWCNSKILEAHLDDYAYADLSKIVKYYNYNGRYLVTCMSYGCMKTYQIVKNEDNQFWKPMEMVPMEMVPVHTIQYVIEPYDDTFLNVRVEETHHLKGDGTPKVMKEMPFLRVPEGQARDAFMNKFLPTGILSTGEHIAGAFAATADELCHLGESYSNMFPR